MIVAAAIIYKEILWTLDKPNRHGHIIHKICTDMGVETVRSKEMKQGFITDQGIFLDRIEAYQHAVNCGQVTHRANKLFSEDVW